MCVYNINLKQGVGNNKSKKLSKQAASKENEEERRVLIKRSIVLGLLTLGVLVSCAYQHNVYLFASFLTAGIFLFLIEQKYI
jgi:hypothetical protein